MRIFSAKLADDVGMIYLIHYFSVPQPLEVVQAVKEMAATRDILVMEDITQALFSKDGERMGFGDYIVASTRKWFPMTDGGLLCHQKMEPAESCRRWNLLMTKVFIRNC